MILGLKKWVGMFHNFIEVDYKLILTWMGSGSMVLLNKFGFNILEYEIWKIILLDALTGISLVVAISYTIARWRKLNKKK